jgi:hypothetical protein
MTDYQMFTAETNASIPEFFWSMGKEAGHWESLEPWPRPLSGVRIDGDHLCFEYRKPYTEGRGSVELAAANFEMLAKFADLANGNPEADGRLIAFVSRYGHLGLCEQHGWPWAHIKPYCAMDRSESRAGCIIRERIQGWLLASRAARAILTALIKPNTSEIPIRLVTSEGKSFGSSDPRIAIFQGWLAGSDLRLWFRPRRLTLHGRPTLWTAIGLELATVAVGAKGIIFCSACGRLDSVKRPHRNGNRRSYCSKCRDKGRRRQGVADYRDRVRRARSLRAEGKSVAEISDLLGIKQTQVKRYLAKGA